MSEKLLPCPFCGGESDLWHNPPWSFGVICDACGCEITSPDNTRAGAIAAWNRRTPAPEGEASLWGCADGNGIDPWLVFRDRPTAEQVAADMNMVVRPLYASPVVPVGSDDTLPPISLDGPHKIGEHRQWLARQLLDSRQDDAEAYSTVIYSPAMTDIWRDDVVPVGVSREEQRPLAETIYRQVEPLLAECSEPNPEDYIDAILAALRPTPTDTGRE